MGMAYGRPSYDSGIPNQAACRLGQLVGQYLLDGKHDCRIQLLADLLSSSEGVWTDYERSSGVAGHFEPDVCCYYLWCFGYVSHSYSMLGV